MPDSLVSVVIPCYNHGRYLPDAIRSAQQQSYCSIQVIVVDDGSSDESAMIAAAAGAAVVRQGNAGLAAARNAGMAAADGEFVVFLDADDELLPAAVGESVALLQARPELACIVRRSQVMDGERRPLPATYAPVDTCDLYHEWLRQNFVWTPGAAMFRRKELQRIGGFPVDVAAASDYAVYLALARNHLVGFDASAAVRYRQHEANMSRDPVLMLGATLRVLRREKRRLPAGEHDTYRGALKNWRAYYGDKIVERMRDNWRARASGAWDARAALTLLRHCPRVLTTHAARKLTCMVSRLMTGRPSAASERRAALPASRDRFR